MFWLFQFNLALNFSSTNTQWYRAVQVLELNFKSNPSTWTWSILNLFQVQEPKLGIQVRVQVQFHNLKKYNNIVYYRFYWYTMLLF